MTHGLVITLLAAVYVAAVWFAAEWHPLAGICMAVGGYFYGMFLGWLHNRLEEKDAAHN